MSKRRESENPSLLDLVLGIAWKCPAAGATISALLLLVSYVFWSADHAQDTSWALVAPCIAVACATMGAGGIMISLVALIRDEILGA